MAIIGLFKPDKDGYAGTIRTLAIVAKVRIVANDRKSAGELAGFSRVRWQLGDRGCVA